MRPAHVMVTPQSEGFLITKCHHARRAKGRGIDQATFVQHTKAAKAGSPVSRALADTEISLETKLVDKEATDPPS
jgi:organic hydroperoxide reductase OsmC/OhrA